MPNIITFLKARPEGLFIFRFQNYLKLFRTREGFSGKQAESCINLAFSEHPSRYNTFHTVNSN